MLDGHGQRDRQSPQIQMTIVRNIIIKLDIPEERHDDVDATFEEFRQAAQLATNAGWDDDAPCITTNKTTLHERSYHRVREETDLQSSLVQTARNLAAGSLSTCKHHLLNGKNASKPEFNGTVVVYNQQSITYNDDHATLATVDQRVRADYVLPADESGTPFAKYWTDDWTKKEATLHKRNGTYFLHVTVEKAVPDADSESETPENGVVLGVDLNVDGSLAVTSTGAFIGNADLLNHKRDEYERRRGALQQTGTRSAHLTLNSISDRFARWSSQYLHRVSNEIVQEAHGNDCTAIAFEDLTHITDRIANGSKFQQWSFRAIQDYVEYKAQEFGIEVQTVAPQYTSQRCSHGTCGFTDSTNRAGDVFECQECGKQLHADYNAARNIGWRLVQRWHTSSAGRATSQLALKTGRLTADGYIRSTSAE